MKCIKFILSIYFLSTFTNGSTLEEIEVALDLFNMEIEDRCNDLAIVQKEIILNTTKTYLKKIKVESYVAQFIRDESSRLHDTHDISRVHLLEPLERQWNIANNMGDVMLPEISLNKLITFKNFNDDLSTNFQIPCLNKTKNCVLLKDDIIKILSTSRKTDELREAWSALQSIYQKNNTDQYPEILKLIQKAAEVNGEQTVEKYWGVLAEKENVYEEAKTFWSEIEPLYNKFHSFVKKRLERYYGELSNSSSIPVYLLDNLAKYI